MQVSEYREKLSKSICLAKDTPSQPENIFQLRLTVKQILSAIMLLTPDEREQLWKMLSMLIENVTIEENIHSAPPPHSKDGKSAIRIEQGDSVVAPKTELLNERLENILDQQIFNAVESELAQRARGQRPEGWLTWEEACIELDALDEV